LDISTTEIAATLYDTATQQCLPLSRVELQFSDSGSDADALAQGFKPYLNLAIPVYSPSCGRWEPSIQRSDTQTMPLIQVRQALTQRLAAVRREIAAFPPLAGVAINQPVGATDAYRFNLQDVVLSAGLVSQPDCIAWVEEGVAVVLSQLHQAEELSGGLLVVNAGAISTEITLIQLPVAPSQLERHLLLMRRIPYGGNAIDQDMITQLLYPTAQGWDSLRLNELNLPLPGEPDLETRYRLQQRLESQPLGRSLLRSVRQIKPSLCQHDVTYRLDQQTWPLHRHDLLNWIVLPYLQQLNREINGLLTQAKQPASALRRVICTGGTATIPAISLWLQQKFAQAEVQVDATSSGAGPTTAPISTSHLVCQGLSLLPSFPRLLAQCTHPNGDLVVLRVVLQYLATLPAPQLVTEAQLLQALAQAGLDPAACRAMLLQLLEGQLPTGLLPTATSRLLFSADAWQTPEVAAIAQAPLFIPYEHQLYRVNASQREAVWKYLQTL
jgi:hypothetical protein